MGLSRCNISPEHTNRKERLHDVIRESEASTIEYAARGAGISRPTATKLLADLVAEGRVRELACGNSRMYICCKNENRDGVTQDSNLSTPPTVRSESQMAYGDAQGDN